MPNCRVCFINGNDRLFRCCQRSIVVTSAAGAEEAKEVAKEEFARLEGIRDWKIHAALIELEAIDIAEEPDTPSRLSPPRTSERLHQQRP